MQSFRSNTTVMIALAVVFGGGAVFLARAWLERQADMNAQRQVAEPAKAAKLVVAATPLRFGAVLDKASLREIDWPATAIPNGAYGKIEDVLAPGRRVVLQGMEPNEPVLKNKITGEGQRAGLAALVSEGFRAVTLRVNDVNGVAGFILPGDRVDVMLSQHDGDKSGSDVVLQNVRILAIDQFADEKSEEPKIVKAVTVETSIQGAQKVSLASLVGTLSLVLRPAGDTAASNTKRVTLDDLAKGETNETPAAFVMSSPVLPTAQDITVRVMGRGDKKEYIVPRE